MLNVPKEEYGTDGTHIIADFYGIADKDGLNNEDLLKLLAKKAIELSNATLIDMFTHKFEPQGVTLSAIISESSMDLHSYPESSYLSVSFYTCGPKANPIKGIEFLRDQFNPEHVNVMSIGRGTKQSMDFKVIHIL